MKKVVGMLAIVGLYVLAYWFWPGEELKSSQSQ